MKKTVWMLLLTLVVGAGVWAAEPANGETPPPPPPDRSGRLIWRAFSQLSEAERKEMMELQARDQDAYRKKMQQKVEELRAREAASEARQKKLIADYRAATPEAKPALKAQLEAMVREGYFRRLNENRSHLAEMKRRVEWLSKELEKREKTADASIHEIVNGLLDGTIPVTPPERRKGPPERR